MIPELEIIIRLGIAAALGMLVGIERERQNQPAGLRTHTILAIGSCLAMTISINLAFQFVAQGHQSDPGRLAAQVVSGIGFLGAGAILRYGTSVKGLTTATSLWTIAIVGLAIGAGHYLAGLATTGMLLIILILLNVLEKKWIHSYETVNVYVIAHGNPALAEDLLEMFKKMKKSVLSIGVENDVASDTHVVTLVVKTKERDPMNDIREGLKNVAGVTKYRLN
ncbi:MAG: MgtC/SapB family protein [Anaerolineaceae bacterium]|jgi:putative Mg2+ transporter-C (MgtC) family protein|nr:MgtC/SapB family protein [Anaerolineaceae bacterium]